MTDRDLPGNTATDRSGTPTDRLPPPPRSRERTFGSPLLFDLTTLQPDQEEHDGQGAPTVYYLAAMLPPPRASSPWPTVVGFGGVILAGVGLGLLLAVLLL
jgi:hypothetical protein